MSQGRKEPHFGTNPLQQKPRELLVSFLHLPPLSFLYFPSPEHSLLGEKQENGNAGSTGCSKLCTQDTCGHRKLGELGAGWVEASVQRPHPLPELMVGFGNGWARRVPAASAQSRTC